MRYGLRETIVGKRKNHGGFFIIYGVVLKDDSGNVTHTVDLSVLNKVYCGNYDSSLSSYTKDLEEVRAFIATAEGSKVFKVWAVSERSYYKNFTQEDADAVNKDLAYIFGAPETGIIGKPDNLNLGIIKP